jgi:predicted transcriptional regulator
MKGNHYLIEIGKRMRKIRKEKQVSIKEMHRITGIAESHITRTERWGVDMKILTMKQIADVLKVDVKDFL